MFCELASDGPDLSFSLDPAWLLSCPFLPSSPLDVQRSQASEAEDVDHEDNDLDMAGIPLVGEDRGIVVGTCHVVVEGTDTRDNGEVDA